MRSEAESLTARKGSQLTGIVVQGQGDFDLMPTFNCKPSCPQCSSSEASPSLTSSQSTLCGIVFTQPCTNPAIFAAGWIAAALPLPWELALIRGRKEAVGAGEVRPRVKSFGFAGKARLASKARQQYTDRHSVNILLNLLQMLPR